PESGDPSGRGRRSVKHEAEDKPKRRARVKKRHTVGRVLLVTSVVLALVTGLSTLYLYRHYNGNLDVINVDEQLGTDRPEKKKVEGPKEPLNILVMGSDDRDAPGNNIDNLTGGGKRSDTTILLHLSADRQRAYGVSIPRDSLVDRPECLDEDLDPIPGGTDVMWNEAFSVGGPACTVHQVEQLTGIPIDHFIVVDFAGFRGMVDAIGGVQVCIPEPGIQDPAHGINIPAGTRKLEGFQALNYVRERYVLGNGSDIGRMKRQQAFLAAMAHQVLSANTLARPDRLLKFLDASTRSLQLDEGLGSLVKIAKLGVEFKNIGLDNIQFITVPWQYAPDDPNRIRWLPESKQVWQAMIDDKPLAPRFLDDAISAEHLPGSPPPTPTPTDTAGPSGSPTGTPSSPSTPSSTPSDVPTEEDTQEAIDNGLCA
ncbi:MAG TPA: LCP family protein, partial [Nocardioides sp.]|nr:LCP family protein [Nocardioides sp.]